MMLIPFAGRPRSPENGGFWMTPTGRKPSCELVFRGCVGRQEACWIAGRSDSRCLFIRQKLTYRRFSQKHPFASASG